MHGAVWHTLCHSLSRLSLQRTCLQPDTGPERSHTKWREADLEWLGVKPDHVQTSVFEMGQEQPNAVYHNTTTVSKISASHIFHEGRCFGPLQHGSLQLELPSSCSSL